MNHILTDPLQNDKDSDKSLKFAVIENELGKVAIDNNLLANKEQLQEEEIIEVTNGCICCHIRGDLVRSLNTLYDKVMEKNLNGILLETTGLADPAPIIQTFFQQPEIELRFKIDGVVTVVDAKHIIERLDEEKPDGVVNEASEQIAFADKILLNKIDLVEGGEDELVSIEEAIRYINPTAKILRTQYSKVEDNNELLNIGGFDVTRALDMDKDFLTVTRKHRKDRRVKSVALEIPGEANLISLQQWLESLISPVSSDPLQQQQHQHQDHHHPHDENGHDHSHDHKHQDEKQPTNLYRYKGICAIKGMDNKFVFQGVGMVMGSYFDQETWAPDETRKSQFVLIGKDLDKAQIEKDFSGTLVTDELRFKVGTTIEANIGEFKRGQVVAQWDEGQPYRIRLEDTGDEIWAPFDQDPCIRLAS